MVGRDGGVALAPSSGSAGDPDPDPEPDPSPDPAGCPDNRPSAVRRRTGCRAATSVGANAGCMEGLAGVDAGLWGGFVPACAIQAGWRTHVAVGARTTVVPCCWLPHDAAGTRAAGAGGSAHVRSRFATGRSGPLRISSCSLVRRSMCVPQAACRVALEGDPGVMLDRESPPLRGVETGAAVDGRAADPSVWLVRPGVHGRHSSGEGGEACEGASLHREPSVNPGRARPYQTATSYLTVHAPALTMALLLEGCCSRSASAAVSMAHVTLARVSAVYGRRAGGTALGGRSSDCAVSCCIATLMRAGSNQNRSALVGQGAQRSLLRSKQKLATDGRRTADPMLAVDSTLYIFPSSFYTAHLSSTQHSRTLPLVLPLSQIKASVSALSRPPAPHSCRRIDTGLTPILSRHGHC